MIYPNMCLYMFRNFKLLKAQVVSKVWRSIHFPQIYTTQFLWWHSIAFTASSMHNSRILVGIMYEYSKRVFLPKVPIQAWPGMLYVPDCTCTWLACGIPVWTHHPFIPPTFGSTIPKISSSEPGISIQPVTRWILFLISCSIKWPC